MPAGTVLWNDPWACLVVGLENAAANTTGEWISTAGFTAAAIHYVYTGGTVDLDVEVRGSNEADKPLSATAGGLIGTQQPAAAGETLVSYAVLPRWLKLAVTNYVAGTANAKILLRRLGGGTGA